MQDISNFKIAFLSIDEHTKYYDDILKLLIDADEEFYPPLSSRTSTTQSDLSSGQKCSTGVLNYFENMKNQRLVVAREENNLLGFVSFRENFTNDIIGETELPDIYISTLIVSPGARGRGVTYAMYKKLFDSFSGMNFFTRTWSTNASHIKILENFGFEIFKTIKNDRGESVDTVYFNKTLK